MFPLVATCFVTDGGNWDLKLRVEFPGRYHHGREIKNSGDEAGGYKRERTVNADSNNLRQWVNDTITVITDVLVRFTVRVGWSIPRKYPDN